MAEQCPCDIDNIILPLIETSLPCHTHPDYLRLKPISDAWIFSRFHDLGTSSSISAEYLASLGVDLLAALTCPYAVSKRLITILKFTVWFFVLDTFIDRPQEMGADPHAADELVEGISSILEGKDVTPAAGGPVSRVIIGSLGDWWNEIHEEMPATQQLRFVRAFKDYLESSRSQTEYRQAQRLMDVETYTLIRRNTICWFPFCVLIEYGQELELDDETLAHPLIRKLRERASVHSYRVNDFFSFKKEYLEGDHLNLVYLMYFNSKNTRGTPLQQIVLKVSEMIKEVENECIQLMSEIKSSEVLMKKPVVQSFLEGIATMLGGNFQWHRVTERYKVDQSVLPN